MKLAGRVLDRYFTLLLLGMTLLFGLFWLLELRSDYLAFEQRFRQECREASSHMVEATHAVFRVHKDALTAAAHVPFIKAQDAGATSSYLSSVKNEFPELFNLAALSKNGKFFASARDIPLDKIPSADNADYFQRLSVSTRAEVIEPHKGRISGELITGIAVPILLEGGGFNGAVAGSIKMTRFLESWKHLAELHGVKCYVYGQDGELYYQSDETMPSGRDIYLGLANRYGQAGDDANLINIDGVSYLYETRVEEISGWRFSAVARASLPLRDYFMNYWWMVALGIPFLLMIAGVAYVHFWTAKARKELAEKEDRYRALVEETQDIVTRVDSNSRLLFANGAARVVFGLEPSSAIGLNALDFVHSDDRERTETWFKASIQARLQLGSYECRMVAYNGRARSIQWRTSFRYDDEGNFLWADSTGRDVTDLRIALAALADSEKKFSKAFMASPAAMSITLVEDGTYLEVNDTFLRLTGYKREEVLLHSSVELGVLSAEDRARMKKELSEKGRVDQLELTVHHRDGTSYDAIFSSELIEISGEKRLLSVAENLTERRKMERALAESEQRYRSIVDNLNGALALCELVPNPEGTPEDYRILAVNPAFLRITGLSAEQVVGRKGSELLPKFDPLWISTCVRVALTGETARFDFYGEVTKRLYDVTIFRPTPGQFVSITYDVTDQRKLEQERQKLEERLRQSQKMEAVGQLAGGIAHDFNNILMGIMGYAEMVEARLKKGSDERSWVSQILAASDRASELVRQILAFSRKTERRPKPVEMAEVVLEAARLLRSSLPKTVQFETSIDPATGFVLADTTEIHQIVMNLCTNALHALPNESGTIALSLSRVEEAGSGRASKVSRWAELTVADNGSGMEQATLQRIFEPYFTTKPQGKGTGMGLSVVHGIVESSGGRIEVESSLGKGTSVKIFLPLTEEPDAAEERPSQGEKPRPKGLGRVMVVDDEEIILKLMELKLTEMGYEVECFVSGRDALLRFKESPAPWVAVITDQSMPVMSGAELSVNLLMLDPSLNVVMCTGFSEVLDEESALALGIRNYLSKPVKFQELARLLKSFEQKA